MSVNDEADGGNNEEISGIVVSLYLDPANAEQIAHNLRQPKGAGNIGGRKEQMPRTWVDMAEAEVEEEKESEWCRIL